MQIQIEKVSGGKLTRHDIKSMHELRYGVFRERLQWDVECDGEIERDNFDELDPTYMLVKDESNKVFGCWRMLPTTGPYMLKDTFPQTLCGQVAPVDENVWELSRFALGPHEGRAHGFCQTAVLMMESAVEFALEQRVTQFVTVTTVAIERLLKTLGVPTRRFGVPVQVGIEKTVAFTIEVNHNTLLLLRRHTGVATNDEKMAA
jgi:acyl homoserine lactone synthase